MRRIAVTLAISSGLLAGAAVLAAAQTTRMRFGDRWPTPDLTPSQRAFASAYVSAITGLDVQRHKRLVHPASLACVRKDNEEFFAELFARHRDAAPLEAPVTVESLPPNLLFFESLAKRGFGYPVRPTHAFHVELVSRGPKHTSVVAFSVLHRGSWYEVLPCPTPEAMAAYRTKKAEAAADEAKARELVHSLRDPLRTELLALLGEGKRVAATKRYAEASGVTLAMASRVVKLLESPPR